MRAPSPNHHQLVDDSDYSDTVWSQRGPLFHMTRPSSILGVVLFHMVGIYLALSSMNLTNQYWTILFKCPELWLTLACEVLISSTSMVINDYYDAKLGRDAFKKVNLHKKVLVNGRVSMALAKRFVTYLYSLALVLVCFVPGAPTRLAITLGLMLTYLYTKHLKPLLGIKNVVCASLVALTPWTSGMASMYTVGGFKTNVFGVASLWRLFAALFLGVLGREIILDCNDVVCDTKAGIRTLPVEYGREVSSGIALATTICMSLIALSQPVLQVMNLWRSNPSASFWGMLKSTPVLSRRLGLALTASIIMLRRSWQVYQTRGKDSKVNSTAVDESLITVIFLLASFV